MDSSFTSLPPMELVMLIMGIVMFLALVFLLIWQVMKQRPFTLLLIGFLIPILLVGFPAIQSIKVKEGTIEINKYAQVVATNPKDTAAVRQLEEKLVNFKTDRRVQYNPEALAAVAHAQLALGRLDSAALTIRKATKLDPKSETVNATATEINQQIGVKQRFQNDVSRLSREVAKLRQQPADTAATATVIQTLSTLKPPRYVDASSALVVAQSYAVLNQRDKSQKVLENVRQADPGPTAPGEPDTTLPTDTLKLKPAKLTPYQKRVIQRELRSAPIIGDKAVIKSN